ncbi:MAG: polysaccharide deacetylase family protein [Bacteroidetes bacterium]|nr:polysaccharide deacetylase family protein [Bacteroidota bacterium]
MYHRVTTDGPVDFLTIRVEELEKQLQHIHEEGYNTISAQQLLDYHYDQKPLPSKPLLLTFDDGYHDNYTLLYPLLLKYRMKATIFLVASLVGRKGQPAEDLRYMTEEQARNMSNDVVGFGFHTADHSSYTEKDAAQIAADIDLCKALFTEMRIPMTPVLAYTYGAYPKTGRPWQEMTRVFREKNIRLAFRIGNRLNKLPLRQPYVVQRVDIRGNESFSRFQKKLRYGGKRWKIW